MNPPRFSLLRGAAFLLAALAVGCGGSNVNLFPPIDVQNTDDAGDGSTSDAITPPDAATGDVVTPPDVASDAPRPDASADVVSPPDVTVGTCASDRDCATGQSCCGFTGRCYDARCLACCMFPPPDAGVDVGTTGCASARDCGAGNECVFPSTACAATGTCMSAIACFVPVTYCSCAGETYTGCRPDRPTATVGACATTTDAGVDTGTSFCAMVRCTATTYCCEAARACIPIGALCVSASDAGTGTCSSNADCPSASYCAGTGCGTPGACAPRPTICSTLFSPVCGCDRVTYSNECTANASGQRVASRGTCL